MTGMPATCVKKMSLATAFTAWGSRPLVASQGHIFSSQTPVFSFWNQTLLPLWYRVFFSKGPTQKSSKYGIGPSQQDKIAKYTGPTLSY